LRYSKELRGLRLFEAAFLEDFFDLDHEIRADQEVFRLFRTEAQIPKDVTA